MKASSSLHPHHHFPSTKLYTSITTRCSYRKAWLAKQKAIAKIYGDWEESYNLLPRWILGIQMTMPGSFVMMKTAPVRVEGVVDPSRVIFHRLFWTFPPCVEAFKHCKPVISIDGTLLYGKYGGMLIIAIAQDGNSNVLPIAFALVEGENIESWKFFLTHMREQVTPQPGILVISDNHPAIQSALNAEGSGWYPPSAYHAFCIRHLAANFALNFKSKDARRALVNAAYAKTGVYIRTQLSFPAKVFLCQAKSGTNGSINVRVMPPTLLAAEKEEAKAVLMLFLKKEGLSNAIAARTVNKSDPFIDHLVSVLHSKHKSRYLVGRELTTLEIRDAIVPYLESLLEEHGDSLVDVVENYPNPPVKEKPAVQVPPPTPIIDSKKLRTVSRVNAIDMTAGNLRPHIVYLIEFGMSIEQINGIIRRFPSFAYYSLEGKIKPVVEFFLELGVPKEDIPTILTKRPQLCGISLSENLKPTMKFLESLGVDKKQWAKVIYRFPALLTYSREKVEESIDFLRELGLSDDNIGKILTRCPNIVSYSVEDNLRPTANYFRSLGVDVGVLLFRCPQNFGLSIEANLKPVTQFFLEKGYTLDEIGTMISRFGALYTFSLADNLIPKWDFFITMGYPNSELVKFPQFFGYSLEERIKPRYARMKRAGVRLLLNQVLSLSSRNFEEALEKKLKKNSS